jgi:hypothetical protein
MPSTTENLAANRRGNQRKQLEKAQNLAEASQALATKYGNDVVNNETKGELNKMGFGAGAQKSTNRADEMVPLYHAYDGRTARVPFYQASQRLTVRFSSDNDVPEEWQNEQVWYLDPPEGSEADADAERFPCRLSREQTDPEINAQMKKAGLAQTCRKRLRGGGFTTMFEADEHFRVKHPRRWASYQRFLGVDATRTAAENQTALMAQIVKLVEKTTTTTEE